MRPLNLFGVEISQTRAAKSAQHTKSERGETGDHVDGAAKIAGLAHNSADRGDHEHQRDQEPLRQLVDQFTLAGGCNQIGRRGPSADKARRGDRPPGYCGYELVPGICGPKRESRPSPKTVSRICMTNVANTPHAIAAA